MILSPQKFDCESTCSVHPMCESQYVNTCTAFCVQKVQVQEVVFHLF